MSQLFSPFSPISMFLGPIFGSHSTLKLGGRGFLAFLPVVRTFFTIIVCFLRELCLSSFMAEFFAFKGERRFGKKKKKICSQKLDKVFNMSKIKKLIKYLLYLA